MNRPKTPCRCSDSQKPRAAFATRSLAQQAIDRHPAVYDPMEPQRCERCALFHLVHKRCRSCRGQNGKAKTLYARKQNALNVAERSDDVLYAYPCPCDRRFWHLTRREQR